MRVAHDSKDAIQLVVMIGAARLHVLLTTVEDWLEGKQLGKDAANGPNICREREHSLRIHTHSMKHVKHTCLEFKLTSVRLLGKGKQFNYSQNNSLSRDM